MYGSAFSSPYIAEIADKRQLLVQTRRALAGVELESGQVLWSQDIEAFRGMNILTPVAYGDTVFTSAYGGRSILLKIEQEFQTPFQVTHENMAALQLHRDQPSHLLAVQLRRAFSGVVSGNVKAEGIRAIEQYGPFELKGDPEVIRPLDALLSSFVARQRMKLPGRHYVPCYRAVA